MPRRSPAPIHALPQSWLTRGIAATLVFGFAATSLVVTNVAATAAPAPAVAAADVASAALPTPDLLDVTFAANGVATDSSTAAHALTAKPTAGTTSESAELGRWVANLDGSQAWGAAWSAADYAKENDGASLEVVFKVDTPITSGYRDVIGNMESAGFGIELVPGADAQHGGIEIYAHTTSGGYGSLPKATYTYGKWVHVIATFDGATKKVYVDGKLISQTTAGSATLTTPPSAARTWIIGGDVNSSGASVSRMAGSLATARIYSEPIAAADVARLALASGAVKDTAAPAVSAVTTPVNRAALNVPYIAPDIQATDDLDPAPGLSISVTGPDQTTAPLDLATRSFTPAVNGVYTLVYTAIDAAGNAGTAKYLVAGGTATLPTDPGTPTVPGSTADGVTDWKFSAIGDIHDNWSELVEAYDFWATQGVETTLWPGDLTNSNTAQEYTELKNTINSVKGYGIEHYVSLGNHDVANGELGDYALFETATGQRPNADYVVNGYHVITVSPGSGEFKEDATPAAGTKSSGIPTVAANNGYGYAATWLKSRLAAITAAEPEKPIFVLVHHPIRCTHYVSNEWYGTGLATGCGASFDSFLENYPQAVVWAGHIHTPNHIPTSLWQGTAEGGGFTTVNAPPLAYYEMESGVVGANSHQSDSTPDDSGNNRETAIVEVDGSKVKISNYDLLADMWEPTVWEWDVAASLNKSATYEERFPLGDARADRTSPPVWQQDDTITVSSVTETSAQVDWTQAEAAPNDVHDIVQKYLVEVVDKKTAQTVLSFQRWSRYYVMPMPAKVGHDVWGLKPGTEYEIRISPINAWAKVGAAKTTTFLTAGSGVLPVVRAATTPAKTGTTGVQYSFPALEAVDDSGVISNKSVKVLGPWGDEVTTTTGAAGTFAPTLPGRYTLVYSATDGAGNKGEARYAVNVILGAIYGNSDKVPAADLLDVDFWNADRTGIADGAKLTDHSPYNREFTRVTGAPITMNTELGKPVATFNNSTDQAYRTAWTEADYALENDGYSFETTFSMPASAPWTGDQSIFSNQQSAGVGFDAYKIGSANCFLTEQQKAGHDFCVTLWTSPMAAKRVSVALDYDTWYQVVATNDLAMERLYVNGEPVAETAGARAPASPTGGANNWVIGGDAAPGNATQFPFTGMISSARIWSNPLTPSAIAALYAGDEDPAGPGTGGAGGPGTPGGALAFTGSSLGGPLGLALGLLLVGAFAFITVRRRSAR